MTLHFPICLVLFLVSRPAAYCAFGLSLCKGQRSRGVLCLSQKYSKSIWSWTVSMCVCDYNLEHTHHTYTLYTYVCICMQKTDNFSYKARFISLLLFI